MTGRFEDFETFEEVVDAFKEQVKFFSLEAAVVINIQRLLREQMIFPVPVSGLALLQSGILFHLCRLSSTWEYLRRRARPKQTGGSEDLS